MHCSLCLSSGERAAILDQDRREAAPEHLRLRRPPACPLHRPRTVKKPHVAKCRPRTRGGGPCPPARPPALLPSSPHPRGWSESAVPPSPFSVVVPAPAGGPVPERVTPDFTASSPHPGGWSDQTRAS